jgi:hypothetical protein
MGKSRLLDEVAAMARRRRREHPARLGSEGGESEHLGRIPQSSAPLKSGHGRGHRSCHPGGGKFWAAGAGAPRLGDARQNGRVTGQSPSPGAPQSLSVLEAVLERITYANEDTGTPSPGWPPSGPARIC